MIFGDENIVYGISQRKDGNMKFANGDNNCEIIQNRKEFFNSLEVDFDKTVISGVCHGDEVRIVGYKNLGCILEATDGLITNKSGLILTITVADCLPIYIYDPVKRVVGLVHVGWRGLLNNILKKSILIFKSNFSSEEKDLLIFIGPHIHVSRYEVEEDIANSFFFFFSAVLRENDSYYLDLSFVAKEQLKKLGILVKNIKISSDCTYDINNKYFSYRHDKPKQIEAMVAYIGLK